MSVLAFTLWLDAYVFQILSSFSNMILNPSDEFLILDIVLFSSKMPILCLYMCVSVCACVHAHVLEVPRTIPGSVIG